MKDVMDRSMKSIDEEVGGRGLQWYPVAVTTRCAGSTHDYGEAGATTATGLEPFDGLFFHSQKPLISIEFQRYEFIFTT